MTGSRLIVALDTADADQAAGWAASVAPHCGLFKLGLEFFLANGAAGMRAIAGRPVFLDLKLHDIPNTVAGAVRAVLPLAPRMLTVHAAGGTAMIGAARQAAEAAGPSRPIILAVTVLTSLDAADLTATGVPGPPASQVLRLARLALAAGADGLVCSPLEVAMLRDALGAGPTLVVPGIRPAGSAAGDQARTMTPAEAMAAGADWIVVGRPITAAPDVGPAAAAVAAAIEAGQARATAIDAGHAAAVSIEARHPAAAANDGGHPAAAASDGGHRAAAAIDPGHPAAATIDPGHPAAATIDAGHAAAATIDAGHAAAATIDAGHAAAVSIDPGRSAAVR